MSDITPSQVIWTLLIFLVAVPALSFAAAVYIFRHPSLFSMGTEWTSKRTLEVSLWSAVTWAFTYLLTLGWRWLTSDASHSIWGLAVRLLVVLFLSLVGHFTGFEIGRAIFTVRKQ